MFPGTSGCDDDRRSRSRFGWVEGAYAVILSLAIGTAITFAIPVLAQDYPQVWIDGAQVWRKGGCGDCHGKYADGEPVVDEAPPGPNLRETALTKEQIAEVIRCGRPGTPMPFNDPRSYVINECYGIPLGEVLAATGRDLTPEQIDSLAIYISEAVKDAGPVGLDACAIYYGGDRNNAFCAKFR
jgi:mono/diheme cytochrome c family protein